MMPSWKHRRRLIYSTYFLSVSMIIYASLNIAINAEIAQELIIGGTAMLVIIITAYTGFSVLDDKYHFKDEEK